MYTAYFIRFLVEPELSEVARQATPALTELVTGLIAQAQSLGEVPVHIDTAAEAAFLLAGAEGLQTSMLLGQLEAERAMTLLDHQLDRVFETGQ